MWVRCVVRRKKNDSPPWPKASRQLLTTLDKVGARFCRDGADLAWASRMRAMSFAGEERNASTRICQGSIQLPETAASDAINRLHAEGFDVLPDPAIASADVWTPYAPGGGLFGTRDHALRLIGADAMPDPALGKGVNVVIFDYGIDDDWLKAEQKRRGATNAGLRGGWPRYKRRSDLNPIWILPGDPPPSGLTHGQMIARNILAIAPGVTLWDAPLLPDTALGPPGIALAEAIFWHFFADWSARRQLDRGAPGARAEITQGETWILVNAWGALDPIRLDPYFDPWPSRRELERGPYWDNPQNYFVEDMARLSENGIDVVFAAGNCGTPGADPRCGETMTGPGRSIHGVNAHAGVLTVGAVRCDGLPLGGSAQGQGALASRLGEDLPNFRQFKEKPDVCAPSHFHETEGDGFSNTGTSAACGIAAGVLAAMRSLERSDQRRTPEEMRALLRETAGPGPWDPRLGYGVINLRAARAGL